MSKVNLISTYTKNMYEVQLHGEVFKCIHEKDSNGNSQWYVMNDEGILFDDDSLNSTFNTIKGMVKQSLKNSSI